MSSQSILATLKSKLSPGQIEWLRDCYYWLRGLSNPLAAYLARRANVGRGTHIDRTAHFLGWNNIRVGRNCMISEGSWLNVNQRFGNHVAINIADDCFIGRRNFFSSGKLIHIGPYALIGADCRFLGSDHVFSDPFQPYIATGTTNQNTIYLGANCWVGANVTFVGGPKIGHGSVIGAGAVVNKDIPPFSLVVGSPARVLKRFDPISREWKPLAEFTEAMNSALPSEEEYLAQLKANAPRIRMPVPAAGRSRGDLP